MKRSILISITLLGLGIFIGVLLVSNFSIGDIKNIFAQDAKLGADVAPVTPESSVTALNQAMIKASEAILPTVVYINVETEIKRNRPNNEDRDGFYNWFRFFMPDENWRSRGSGSGVIISSNGYIVTNSHVVDNAIENGIKVQTFDKKEYTAKLVGKDPYTDLAVIKIEAENLPVAHFADINTVKVGEIVFAVGNPIGLSHTVTQGIVSAIGRGSISRRGGANIEHYIQTDAAINPGNSGGGLFNIYGSLVGINTAIATETGGFMGYGFAIPVDLMKAVVEDLIDDGKINRGYIGVFIDKVDEVVAKGMNLPRVQGVLVQGLVENGAAKEAGIETGDIILEVDGKEVNSPSELQSRIVFYKAGDKVTLTIWRDGKKINKVVKLKSRDDDDVAVSKGGDDNKKESEPKSNEPINFEKLGFTVAPLSNARKKELGVEYGVIVTEVKRFSPASDRGLPVSAVIIEADRKPVKSPQDLKKMIESKKEGEVIVLNIKFQDTNRIVALQVGKS